MSSRLRRGAIGVFFILVAISVLANFVADRSEQKERARQQSQRAVRAASDAKRWASLTPAERAEQETKSADQKARAEMSRAEKARLADEAVRDSLGLKWAYNDAMDPMTKGAINTAYVRSLNEVEFPFPYSGAQRARLDLRIHQKFGSEVIVRIERGQFLCSLTGCQVSVRFGDAKPTTFRAVGPSDHSRTSLFITPYQRFVTNLSKVNRVFVETEFYRAGTMVFEFDVRDLFPYYKAP